MILSVITAIICFLLGYAARAIVEPKPTSEFHRYSAVDLGMTADEAVSIRARMRNGWFA